MASSTRGRDHSEHARWHRSAFRRANPDVLVSISDAAVGSLFTDSVTQPEQLAHPSASVACQSWFSWRVMPFADSEPPPITVVSRIVLISKTGGGGELLRDEVGYHVAHHGRSEADG
jgi:hypothetical protein